MVTFLQFVQITSAVLMILLVLLHSPKGDGLASIGGASQLFSSQKGVEAGLNKITAICATVFIVVSLVLGLGFVK
jgi:preprotein translocase subunit SecG